VVEVGKILGVGDVHAFIGPETPNVWIGVRSVVFRFEIEFAAAVVGGVGIVIGHTFPTKVVVSAFHAARDLLRPRSINRILERLALVVCGQSRVAARNKRHRRKYHDSENNRRTVFHPVED